MESESHSTNQSLSENLLHKQDGFIRFVKAGICSFTGAFFGALSSFPFDTIKVRMQIMQKTFTSIALQMAKEEGLISYYKGVTVALS